LENRVTLWDYIFLTRPILLVPVWAFLLLGYYRAGGKRFFVDCDFITVLIAYTALIASVYILNQITDVASDSINKKHLLLAEGIIPVNNAYIEVIILLVIAVLFCIRLPWYFIFLFLLSFLFGVIYSIPPFKFKARPILDLAINAFGYGFLNFTIGWMTQRSFSSQTFFNALPYIFAVCAVFINATIPDIEGDKKSKDLTTGIFLGRDNAPILSAIFIFLCALTSIILRDWVCFIPAVVALPLFLLASVKKEIKYVLLSIRIGGPLLILITGIIFPYFLPLFLLVFIFLRIYYKKRFGIIYPSLQWGQAQK
jgi:4-hydroxybenzoate polyprenyltransferase